MLDIVVHCLLQPFKEPWTIGIVNPTHSKTRKLRNTVCTQVREIPVQGSPVGWSGLAAATRLPFSAQISISNFWSNCWQRVWMCLLYVLLLGCNVDRNERVTGTPAIILLPYPYPNYRLWSLLSGPDHKTSYEKHGRSLAPKVEDSYSHSQ